MTTTRPGLTGASSYVDQLEYGKLENDPKAQGRISVGGQTIKIKQIATNDNISSTALATSPQSNLIPVDRQQNVDVDEKYGSTNEDLENRDNSNATMPENRQRSLSVQGRVRANRDLQLDAANKRSLWQKAFIGVGAFLGGVIGGAGGLAGGIAAGGGTGAVTGAAAGLVAGPPGAIVAGITGASAGILAGGSAGLVLGAVGGAAIGVAIAEKAFGGKAQGVHLQSAIQSLKNGDATFPTVSEARNLEAVKDKQWRRLLHVPNKHWWAKGNSRVGNKQDRQQIRQALVAYVAKHGLTGANDYKKRLTAAANSDTPRALQTEITRAQNPVDAKFDQFLDGLASGISDKEAYQRLNSAVDSFLDDAETRGFIDDPDRRSQEFKARVQTSVAQFAARNPKGMARLVRLSDPNGPLALLQHVGQDMAVDDERRTVRNLGGRLTNYAALMRNSLVSTLRDHNQIENTVEAQQRHTAVLQVDRRNSRKIDAMYDHIASSLPMHRYEHLELKSPTGFKVSPDGTIGGQSVVSYSAPRNNTPSVRLKVAIKQHIDKQLAKQTGISQVGGVPFSTYAAADLPRMHVTIASNNKPEFDTYDKDPETISEELRNLAGSNNATKVLSGVLNQRALMPLTTNFVRDDLQGVFFVHPNSRQPASVMDANGSINNIGNPKQYGNCNMSVSKNPDGNFKVDIEWPLYFNGFKVPDTEDQDNFDMHDSAQQTNPAVRATLRTTWIVDGNDAANGVLTLTDQKPLTVTYDGRLGPRPDNNVQI